MTRDGRWSSVRARVVVGVMLAAVLLGSAASVGAQTPPPTPGLPPTQPGDILWTFANEPPLSDARVQLALATLAQSRASPPPIPAGRLHFISQPAPGVLESRPLAPADQVPLLLAAAGFAGVPFTEVRPCVVWAAPPPVGVQPALAPGDVARNLANAIREGLASLGVQTQPCIAVATPEDAHILVWVAGGPPPVIPRRLEPTWLSAPGLGPPLGAPPRVTPATPPRVGPAPPRTGGAGLASGESQPAVAVLLALLGAGAALGARRLTRGAKGDATWGR